MPNNDILDDLLVRPDKAIRKAEGVVEPARSNQGDESGYDLTNPNLHHGAEAKYAPTLQIVSKSGSVVASAEAGLHEAQTIGESSRLPVADRYSRSGDQRELLSCRRRRRPDRNRHRRPKRL